MRIEHKAHFIGHYKGKKVYRFPVVVTLNKGFGGTADDWLNPGKANWEVISHTAAEAADFVRNYYATRAETEIQVYGPKGGKAAYRFIGWHSAIGAGLDLAHRNPQPKQLGLDVNPANDEQWLAERRAYLSNLTDIPESERL